MKRAPGKLGAMKYWLVLLLVLTTANARAQKLVPPDEIVIHVNSDVRSTEFVEPLVCELAKVVQAPVRATKIELALTDDLLESRTQFSPRKIVRKFAAATASESEQARPFRYLILDHDLKVPELNYVFAETYTPPISVISVRRLAPNVEPWVVKKAAEITLHRVYKLMLKSVAVMAGLQSGGCVMMFPRSLPDLDAKPSEYCPNDRAALVASRVIKETPSATCSAVVAQR
jgi:predicted Zn-dependent protease